MFDICCDTSIKVMKSFKYSNRKDLKQDHLEIQHPKIENSRLGLTESLGNVASLTPPWGLAYFLKNSSNVLSLKGPPKKCKMELYIDVRRNFLGPSHDSCCDFPKQYVENTASKRWKQQAEIRRHILMVFFLPRTRVDTGERCVEWW